MDLEHAPNAELLAAFTGKPSADLLLQQHGSLTNLAQLSLHQLQQVSGVGQSRAKAIRAAFLLAQRLTRESYAEAVLLDCAEKVADFLREEFRPQSVEQMRLILLNSRRRLIAVHLLCQGSLDTLPIHPREVFHAAIAHRAAAIVLAHNHPSGDPTPSEADIRLTRDLVRAGQFLRIEVTDHVIMGRRTFEHPRDYVSLREMGYFA